MSLLLNRLAPQTTAPQSKAAFCLLPGPVQLRTVIRTNASLNNAHDACGARHVLARAAMVSGRLEQSASGWNQQAIYGW